MTLNSQSGGDAITNIDHSGTLAGAHQYPWSGGREPTQMNSGTLVRAVFGPHHRVHSQLKMIGFTTLDFSDQLELIIGETE